MPEEQQGFYLPMTADLYHELRKRSRPCRNCRRTVDGCSRFCGYCRAENATYSERLFRRINGYTRKDYINTQCPRWHRARVEENSTKQDSIGDRFCSVCGVSLY